MRTRTKKSLSALLLIDVVDPELDQKNRQLRINTMRAGRNILTLKARARKLQIPVIFANDHFGDWHSDFSAMVRQCRAKGGISAKLIEALQPDAKDYSIIKPRHSAFYGTPLAFLLEELGVKRLILAGLETDICVMFTANDAYIRRFDLWVPRNCVAATSAARAGRALHLIKQNLNADVRAWNGRMYKGAG